jgi:hypothetical protein
LTPSIEFKRLKTKEIEILCSQKILFKKNQKTKPKKWKLVLPWPPFGCFGIRA